MSVPMVDVTRKTTSLGQGGCGYQIGSHMKACCHDLCLGQNEALRVSPTAHVMGNGRGEIAHRAGKWHGVW